MTQKILRTIGVAAVLASYFLMPGQSMADVPANPDLIIAQIKVTTAGQLVSIYNNSSQTIDMSSVALQYFNSYQLTTATSTKTIQLSGNLPAHSYYTVNDGPLTLCYQTVVQSASLSFSTKSGLVEVTRLSQQAGGGINFAPQDFAAWSSTAVAGVQTMPAEPAFLQRQMSAGQPVAKGAWQPVKPSASNICDLVTVSAPSTVVPSSNQLLPASPPPATVVSTASPVSNSKLPLSDVGLMSPQLSELLPNPASPQTDAKDEFVEVYNANNSSFDLTGFKLQTASSSTDTKHSYTFPAATVIAPKSFAAYPSANISISLTNTSGIVWLLDPNGKVISQTDVYSSAKDGQAWALANGKWYWTATPTPGKANVIKAAADQKAKTGSGVGTVKSASTNTPSQSSSSQANDAAKPRSLNSAVLVGVGTLAVVYGLYEYRRDLANAVQKFKRNRAVRRENRPKT
ncbi:MAG: lamin tail domain-containing protein [Candidatus Saccharimonadales bacterium]